jgi:hypothetical protein
VLVLVLNMVLVMVLVMVHHAAQVEQCVHDATMKH